MAYSPTMQRWMQEEPFGAAYVDGPNLYQSLGDNPIGLTDATGLWKIERKGDDWATATPGPGDTARTLAATIHLDVNERSKWLEGVSGNGRGGFMDVKPDEDLSKMCDVTFKVPNTAYIEVSSYGAFGSALRQMTVTAKNGMKKAFQESGFKVVIDENVTSGAALQSVLNDRAIYAFMYIGHATDTGKIYVTNPNPENPEQDTTGFGNLHPIHKLVYVEFFACYIGNFTSVFNDWVTPEGIVVAYKGNLGGPGVHEDRIVEPGRK